MVGLGAYDEEMAEWQGLNLRQLPKKSEDLFDSGSVDSVKMPWF
jgi:hypothetical protein